MTTRRLFCMHLLSKLSTLQHSMYSYHFKKVQGYWARRKLEIQNLPLLLKGSKCIWFEVDWYYLLQLIPELLAFYLTTIIFSNNNLIYFILLNPTSNEYYLYCFSNYSLSPHLSKQIIFCDNLKDDSRKLRRRNHFLLRLLYLFSISQMRLFSYVFKHIFLLLLPSNMKWSMYSKGHTDVPKINFQAAFDKDNIYT